MVKSFYLLRAIVFLITFLVVRFFTHSFLLFLLIIFLSGNRVYADTSVYRSSGWVATDGIPGYANTTGCQKSNDGLYCSRPNASGYANLYFSSFGNLAAFTIPQNATITKLHIRVTGKNSDTQYVGVNDAKNYMPFLGQCQTPSDLWEFGLGATDTVREFHTATSGNGLVNCITAQHIDTEKLTFRINRSSGLQWSSDIDNFQIAFDYDPPPLPPPAKTPLIIIPGIGGSELKVSEQTAWSQDHGHGGIFTHTYPAGEKIWVNELEAAKPGDDDYFDILRMMPDGITSETDLALTGNLFSLYQATINFFVSSGYTLNKDLFVFPYDWRKDNMLATELLGQKIQEIKFKTGSEKVDILTHSMGGIIARKYISDPINAQSVKKLFVLGTPHLGAVKLLKALQYGDYFGPSFLFGVIALNPNETRDVMQNFIGGFELIPTNKYFDFYSDEDNLHPFPFRDDRDIDSNGVAGTLNYDQTKNLLTNLDHNTSLFDPAEAFHTIDDNLDNANGVEIINIVGSGQPTLGQIIEKYSFDTFGIKIPSTDEISINGDGTVPLFSASLIDSARNISLLGNAKVFYSKQGHGNLVSYGPALNLVKNILNGSNQIPSGISTTPYNFSGTMFSVHSPVNIHVYDANNHTGQTSDGDIEENIPGSSYDTLGNAKFVYVPGDGVYTIRFEATDNGSFDFKIRTFENSINTETVLYKDIPLTAATKAQTTFDTNSNQSPVIDVDEDGDGTVDVQADRFSIVEGEANNDYSSPLISTNVSPQYIWPPNGKTVNVNITGTIVDDHPYLMKLVIDDEYDAVEPSISTYYETDFSQNIQLQASRRGDDIDGRKYTVIVFAVDIAGNTSLSTFDVVVPHDQRNEK